MKTRSNDRPKQPTPKELTDSLLDFLRRKFYAGNTKLFFQHRANLLAWVVLYPAAWLNGRAVTLPLDRYREIFMKVMMDAVVHGAAKVAYPPAYFRQVIQSHFKVHGEDYYNEAKSARSLVDNAMLLVGKAAPVTSNPIRELAAARSIIMAAKPTKKPAPTASQPTLF